MVSPSYHFNSFSQKMKTLIGLVVIFANSSSAAAMGSNCSSLLSDAGLNMTVLVEAAAHGIHSINIKDLRYYIDPSAPEVNNIPTVNPNLTHSDHLVPSAPLGFSDFATPGMRAFDTLVGFIYPAQKSHDGLNLNAALDLKNLPWQPKSVFLLSQ